MLLDHRERRTYRLGEDRWDIVAPRKRTTVFAVLEKEKREWERVGAVCCWENSMGNRNHTSLLPPLFQGLHTHNTLGQAFKSSIFQVILFGD